MSNISLTSTPHPSPSSTPPSRSPSLTHDSSFIIEAYSWLLENVANPYPSLTVKTSLAQRHNCSLSSVNSWFVNAQRRIGWTTLCRTHFGNYRADALDAAYRALVKEDSNRPLPPDIVHAFIGIKVAVEERYLSISTRSATSDDTDTVVKDMPDLEGSSVSKRNLKGSRLEGTMELPQIQKQVAQNCYPSSDHSESPSSSSVPALDASLTNDSERDHEILPPTLAGRKRRLSSSEGPHTSTSESTPRLMKRLRRSHCATSSADFRLPSPVTSTEERSENDQIQGAQSLTNSESGNNVDTSDLPKRPQGLMAEPCGVFDSLSPSSLESERTIDEWFKTNFDTLFAMPPPVDVTEPDQSTQWEVELFNNYTIPEVPRKTLALSTGNNQTLSSTDLIALEGILQSIGSGGFVGSSDITHLAPVPDPVAQSILLPDFSYSTNWTAFVHGDPSGPADPLLFPQPYAYSTLPEIDLPILQLPQAWSAVAS